jgi:hypothetical protein
MTGSLGPAQRGLSLAQIRCGSRIAIINGKGSEKAQPAAQFLQCWLLKQQAAQQCVQIVDLGNGQSQVLQQGLKILLGRLLTMKTDPIM